MSHALTMNNFTAPHLPCNQTVMGLAKDRRWRQEMRITQSALRVLQHFQGQVWYEQGCEKQCGRLSYYHDCKKLSIPSTLRKALQTYVRFYLFKNEEEDSQEKPLYYPSSQLFECPIADPIQFSVVPTLDLFWTSEREKIANFERWIQKAMADMEPAVKDYEKGLNALKSMNTSGLSPSPSSRRARSLSRNMPASPWFWPILFLVGGPAALVIGGVYYFAKHWPNNPRQRLPNEPL